MPASGYHEAEADAGAQLLIQQADRAPMGALLLVIAVLWLAPAVRGLVDGDPAIVPGLGPSGAYIAGAVGVALAVVALDWLVRGRVIAIRRGTVVVTVWSLFGRDAWHEPLANYRQIRAEREQRPHRYGERSWYIVRLCHPESGKAVELARAEDPALIDRRARDYAGRLGLPLSWQHDEPPATGGRERDGEVAAVKAVGRTLPAGAGDLLQQEATERHPPGADTIDSTPTAMPAMAPTMANPDSSREAMARSRAGSA